MGGVGGGVVGLGGIEGEGDGRIGVEMCRWESHFFPGNGMVLGGSTRKEGREG